MAGVGRILRRLAFIAFIALGAAAVAGLGYGLYTQGLVRFAYPSQERYPVRGVDVSHHQGPIDWSRVAADGVEFAFIKASEGGDFRDRMFRQNAAGAAAAGVPAGAYHFFTLCKSGREQAANFLAATEGAVLSLPPVVDLEYLGNCSNRLSPEAFKVELRAFLADVEGAAGGPAILYVTRAFHDAYLADGTFYDHPIWWRDLFGGLSSPRRAPIEFWQFANRARVDGVEGPIDLNVYNGSRAEFARLIDRPL